MRLPTKLAMIRQAERVDADGVAWRRRMERWLDWRPKRIRLETKWVTTYMRNVDRLFKKHFLA